MRSVCARSLLRSIFSSLQLRTISAAAFAGMMPSRAWTRARAASMSRYLRVRFSSDHTWRMASVLKRLPKMAESMMVAGMFCGSCSGRGCFDERRRIHGQPAFMVAGPQVKRPAVGLRLAADEEGVNVEDRAHRAELEPRDSRIRQLPAQQIDEERRDQRTMHDQARVALDLRHITAIVVDAVAVERERRIAEQQHLVRYPLLLPGGCAGNGVRRNGDVGRLRRLAVDDVLELGQRDVVLAADTVLMPDFHEHECTAPAGFFV